MLLALVALLLIAAAPSEAAVDCAKSLPHAALSPNYNETIAHAIHSMTVQGLKLFNDHATENNFVPTVNQDIDQPNLVLDHAPDDPVNHDFTTTTMNIIDKILSSLGDSKDGLGPNWSPIERVAHVFHMWDLWYEIKRTQWDGVQKYPPADDVCTCLVSVDFNGIKDAVHWVAEHYKTGTPITLLNRPIPKLVDSDSWLVWKNRLLHYYTPAALRDAAMYLHCISKFW